MIFVKLRMYGISYSMSFSSISKKKIEEMLGFNDHLVRAVVFCVLDLVLVLLHLQELLKLVVSLPHPIYLS